MPRFVVFVFRLLAFVVVFVGFADDGGERFGQSGA